MPFDATPQTTLSPLEQDIVDLSGQPGTQRMLRAFSPWTVRAAQAHNARSRYVLEHDTAAAGRPAEQYFLTNLVLQGGGMLGLAHAGLIRGLELAGFRFPGIAGTSAGAILVMGGFAARGDDLLAPMSRTVTSIIADAPMADFVDGPRQVRRLLKRYASGRSLRHPVLLAGLWQAVRRLLTRRGLNPGHVFEEWSGASLSDLEVNTVADLCRIADTLARDLGTAGSGSKRNPFTGTSGKDLFKIITTAMPTGMRFELPGDLSLLSQDYDDVTPARLLRMSMSIPLFFEPVRMAVEPKAWRDFVADAPCHFVSDRVAAELSNLTELTFLDGGLISNLPTDALVENMSDEIGTISVPLVQTEQSVRFRRSNRPMSLLSESAAVANAVRLQGDRDAHSRSRRQGHHNRKAFKIDTGSINWLDFSMPDGTRDRLFELGLERVRTALDTGEFSHDTD